MSSEAQNLQKKLVQLRIEFIHKPIKVKKFGRKYPFLIQNEPFEYGVRIKNIGDEPFSGALIKSFIITIPEIVEQKSNKTPKIKPLNPGEDCELYFDHFTIWHEGSIHTECILEPENENEEIQSYQYHRDHDTDEPYVEKNKWWRDYYCQGQLQLLQSRTNNLILLLTTITVVEAIFGLNNVLKFLAKTLGWCFDNLSVLFNWLAS